MTRGSCSLDRSHVTSSETSWTWFILSLLRCPRFTCASPCPPVFQPVLPASLTVTFDTIDLVLSPIPNCRGRYCDFLLFAYSIHY
ncbi:hypothetical protein PUN28_016415 [Cardiocondyla obscurior]|uniref:Secreted protein n=1 Tax=Cardiocondyla obscurior TaxID=286306 RepID=A0AAW2EQQ7_9HYME